MCVYRTFFRNDCICCWISSLHFLAPVTSEAVIHVNKDLQVSLGYTDLGAFWLISFCKMILLRLSGKKFHRVSYQGVS